MNLFFFFKERTFLHHDYKTISPKLNDVPSNFNFHRWGLHIMRYFCIPGSGPTLRTSSGAGSKWAGETRLWLWHGLLLWPNLPTSKFSPFCHLINLSKHSSSQITFLWLKKFSKAPLCLQDKVRGPPPGLQSLPQSASWSYLLLGVHTNPLLLDHESTQASAFNEDWLIHRV